MCPDNFETLNIINLHNFLLHNDRDNNISVMSSFLTKMSNNVSHNRIHLGIVHLYHFRKSVQKIE
jgi:hypothetical protein